MARPRLCIFDEPSLGLAPKIVAEVAATLARIKAMGKTILLVEQNSLLALRLADRAYLFEAGEIVLTGTGAELQSNPEVAKAYLGH
jgi:branched-chain amino acid transport system ATP-binding protein